ncbi:hypothetical protein HDU85_002780 [Gaertneriomyces sp. JEL0708]|nr:hypothetical protein HDU85_002780 [Gaertneriomyces sp. JEL0708]
MLASTPGGDLESSLPEQFASLVLPVETINPDLRARRKQYLKLQILWETVEKIVTERNADEDTIDTVADETEVWDLLAKVLVSAQVGELLRPNDVGEKPCVLGFDHDKWNGEVYAALRQIPDELITLLHQHLAIHIRDKCASLSDMSASNARLAAAKAHHLPAALEARIVELQNNKRRNLSVRIRSLLTLQKALNAECQTLQNLFQIITHYKVSLEPSSHEAFAGYFSAGVHTAYLKLQCLQRQLTLMLHPPSLREDQDALDRLADSLEEELRANEQRLSLYSGVGEEFAELVAAYGDVVNRIQIVRGDLARIDGV